MKIFTDNQVDIATVSSDDASVNYPASNVQDTKLSRIFRGDKSINFDITGAGGIKHIYQEFTNLVQDPTDLRDSGSNWTKVNGDGDISILSINGNLFTKVTNDGANIGYVKQSFTASFSNLILTGQVIIKKGSSSGNTTQFIVRKTTATAVDIFSIVPDFDNYPNSPATPATGTLLDYTWYDEETLKINFKCDTLSALTNDVDVRCFGSNNATDAEYTYYTEVQLIDDPDIIMFSFVDGTHSADIIDETSTMPDKFIIRLKNIKPRFPYDISGSKWFLEWKGDADSRLFLYYSPDDFIYVSWRDNGTLRKLASQQFDDGSSFTDIDQKLDLVVFLNLSSGGINDSMFIVIPQESGSINTDNSWDGTPDIKSTTFSTLSIGYYPAGNSLQADSDYEAVQVYEWDGTKPTITSSDDVDDYLVDKKILLDKTYMKRLTATDLLIANTTINAGDTITLRANDVDSFGVGTPVDESIDYDGSDILTHNFTKAGYQYWRLIVNSSNIIDFGRVFLGESFTLPDISPSVGHSRQSQSKKAIGIAGQSYLDKRYFNSIYSVRFPKISHAEKTNMITQFETIDIGVPFFVTFDETELDFDTVYVTIDGNALNFNLLINSDYYESNLSLMEAF